MISKAKIIGVVVATIIATLATVCVKSYINSLYVLPPAKVDKDKMKRQTAKGFATVQTAAIVPSATIIKGQYKVKMVLSVMVSKTWASKTVVKYYWLDEKSLSKVLEFLQIPADINPNNLNDLSVNWIRKGIHAREYNE
jgi:hypothetical protein